MCECVKEMNRLLEEANCNTQIKVPFLISNDLSSITTQRVSVEVEKADKSVRKRPTGVYASYCPFCGEKYSADDAAA